MKFYPFVDKYFDGTKTMLLDQPRNRATGFQAYLQGEYKRYCKLMNEKMQHKCSPRPYKPTLKRNQSHQDWCRSVGVSNRI